MIFYKTKYRTGGILFGILFLVLMIEIVGRWGGVIKLYAQFLEKNNSIASYEELEEKKHSLLVKKKNLAMLYTKRYQQNQIGVFEYLSVHANQQSLKFQSLIPTETNERGEIKEYGFKIEVLTRYHQLGSFINAIETGVIPINIRNIEITSVKTGYPKLHGVIEGTASVLSKNSYNEK